MQKREGSEAMRLFLAMLFVLLPAVGSSFAGEIKFEKMRDWSVVVADDATSSERYAGEEFQSLLRQLIGLNLPIVDKARGRSSMRSRSPRIPRS